MVYQIVLRAKNEMGSNSEDYSKFKKACITVAMQENVGHAMQIIEDAVKNYPGLIQDLNTVLPPRFRIETNQLDMNQAVEFIHQVKRIATPQIYHEFITTLKQHESQEISMEDMNLTISTLLNPYPQLSLQFKRFVQNDLAPQEDKIVESVGAAATTSAFTKHKKLVKKPEGIVCQASVATQNKTLGVSVNAQQSKTFAAKQATGILATQKNANLIADDQSEYSAQRVTIATVQNQSSFMALKTLPKTEQQFFDKLRAQLRDDSYYEDIMKCFFCYVEGVFNFAEFFDLITPLFDKSTDDLLHQLKNMVISRDNSRRNHNLLCKPFSEYDTSNFRKISYSYYEMPPDFPRPLCLGRSEPEWRPLYKAVFNEDYSSLPQGSESFKFKTKNQYEEVLFKVEDEIYKMDFENGNIKKTMMVLEEEKNKIDKMTTQQEREAYKLDPKKFNRLRLKQIEKIYGDLGQEMLRLLPLNPVKAIPIIYERFRISYGKNTEEKQECLRNWHDICEKNFHKSLDHRSFHFKAFEKKQQQVKAYQNELKSLQNMSLKSKRGNVMLGGSENCEFYSPYALFEKSICVFNDQDTKTQEILNDHPINLKDPKLSEEPHKLPQMRFLFNNAEILKLAFEVILTGIRFVAHSQGDKDKMRTNLKLVMSQLFGLNYYQELRHRASSVNHLEDTQIEQVLHRDFYDAKVNPAVNDNFSFKRFIGEEMPSVEENDKPQVEEVEILQSSPEQKVNKNSMSYQLKPITLQSYEKDKHTNQEPIFSPHFIPQYKLMYTSQSMYVFIRQLYTIYERLIMAKNIINQRVDDEVQSKQNHDQTVAHEIKDEKYEVYLGGVLSAINNTIDAGKYEDFSRAIFGQRAYLLFSFDKLITTTAKQLLSIANDESSQRSVALYQKFMQHLTESMKVGSSGSEHWHQESMYLSNFVSQMQEINSFSGMGIRLLFSPISKIMSIHSFSTNPFSISSDAAKKAQAEINQYAESQVTREVASDVPAYQIGQSEVSYYGGATNKCIFLERNKVLGKRTRRMSDIEISQNMIFRLQPQVFRVAFEPGKEDSLLYRRKSLMMSEDEQFLYDVKTSLRYQDIIQKRFEQINNSGASAAQDEMMIDQ